MTAEEQAAFKALKAELKALQRALSAKDTHIADLERQSDALMVSKTLASRGSLEAWIRKRRSMVTVHVLRHGGLDTGRVGLSISHDGAEIHGEGHTLDEAFEQGLAAALKGLEEAAAKERERLL